MFFVIVNNILLIMNKTYKTKKTLVSKWRAIYC